MGGKQGALIIIGGCGELGSATVAAAASKNGWNSEGSIVATFHKTEPSSQQRELRRVVWKQLDCGSHKALRKLIADIGPSAVIYCAVPKHGGAGSKPSEVLRLGIVDDVLAAAEATAMVGGRFIAVSTDQVFDGKKGMYSEADKVSPTNAYAQSKVEMEEGLQKIGGNIVIARTSLILTEDPPGKGWGFVMSCVEGHHDDIILFTDEKRNISFSDDLGRALVELAEEKCMHRGILHLVSSEVTNRYELAKIMAMKMGIAEQECKFRPGLSAESKMNRPLDLSINTSLLKTILKTNIQGVSERLRGT